MCYNLVSHTHGLSGRFFYPTAAKPQLNPIGLKRPSLVDNRPAVRMATAATRGGRFIMEQIFYRKEVNRKIDRKFVERFIELIEDDWLPSIRYFKWGDQDHAAVLTKMLIDRGVATPAAGPYPAKLNQNVDIWDVLDEDWKTSQPSIREKPKKTKTAYVYLIRAENGLIKIGKTIDLDKRLEGISGMSPEPLELIYSIKTTIAKVNKLEAQLHYTFNNSRSHGEWFDLSVSDIEYVKKLHCLAAGIEYTPPRRSLALDKKRITRIVLVIAIHLILIQGIISMWHTQPFSILP